MAIKITFVHASITSCGFNSFGHGDPTESSWINHGLCSISAYLKEKGLEVSLIDLRHLSSWEDFKSQISKQKPDIVGLSMMSVDYNPVMKCLDIIKDINANIITVVGGPHPTLMPEELFDNQAISYIIKGEGEISFYTLLQNITKGIKIEKVITGIRPDLDKIPFVDRQLYAGGEKPIVNGFDTPFVTIIAGRGCIYNCSFCQPAEKLIFGNTVRRRSVNNVICELKALNERYNFKSLMIHDDCLTEDEKWIYEFCSAYKQNRFNQPFICQSRADIITKKEDMVKSMRDAGLKMFIIGLESGNQRILNFLRKGTTVEQNYKAAQICHRHGIKIFANYMIGIPTETKKEVLDTVKMIKQINPEHCSAAFFTPHPGSDLYEYCLKNRLSLIQNHDDYRRNPKNAKIKNVDYGFLNYALSLTAKKTARHFILSAFLNNALAKSIKTALKKSVLGQKIIVVLKRAILRENKT